MARVQMDNKAIDLTAMAADQLSKVIIAECENILNGYNKIITNAEGGVFEDMRNNKAATTQFLDNLKAKATFLKNDCQQKIENANKSYTSTEISAMQAEISNKQKSIANELDK